MSRRVEHGDGIVSSAPVRPAAVRELATLPGRPLNFEPIGFEAAAEDPDWHVDHAGLALPEEEPGAPQPGGSFTIARDALVGYEFADPRLVRAVYDESAPLEGRDLLLVGRFFGLRFHMGVRIVGVVEEEAVLDGRPVHRFRFGYRTLEGHLERGHMDYELLKWPDTGEVAFRIHAYSTRGDIDDPFVRLGFALFARPLQLRFYDRSLRRMRALVTERLAAA